MGMSEVAFNERLRTCYLALTQGRLTSEDCLVPLRNILWRGEADWRIAASRIAVPIVGPSIFYTVTLDLDLTEEERDILQSNVPDYYRSLVLVKIGISENTSDPSNDRPKTILLNLPLTRLNST